MSHYTTSVIYALIAGLIPCLFWLWFWLREDNEQPEPRSAIALTFIGGMLIIIPTIFFQTIVHKLSFASDTQLILFAAIEEILKILVVYIVAIKFEKTLDEPIDYLIYTITSALGFAAIENTLYVFKPILSDNLLDGLANNNYRFIGATLLHVAASAAIGSFMAFVYYRGFVLRIISLFAGILWATVLHSAFNIFIIRVRDQDTFLVFGFVWFLIITLLISFEFIKKLKPNSLI